MSAADSVFSFISETAEEVPEGVRWQTFDYEDRPQYHPCIFNGVGGIPIFLSAYHQVTRNPRALELARGALAWAFTAEPSVWNHQRGAHTGKLGLVFSACCYNRVSPEAAFGSEVSAVVNHLLAEPPGPITDLMGGEASNGWVLLQLWRDDPRPEYLKGAVRCAKWIEGHLIRDDRGTHCLVNPGGPLFGKSPRLGLSHGISGVAHFFVCLFSATEDTHWRNLATEILDTLIRYASSDRGGLNWPPNMEMTELPCCQYSHGSPGIGLVFAHAARVLAEPAYLKIALEAGETTYQYADHRQNPTLCIGLAGGGELLIELYRETGDAVWLGRAREFADMTMRYQMIEDGKHFWPTDTPGCFSADFVYGASGTGYFFLRVAYPDRFAPPLL